MQGYSTRTYKIFRNRRLHSNKSQKVESLRLSCRICKFIYHVLTLHNHHEAHKAIYVLLTIMWVMFAWDCRVSRVNLIESLYSPHVQMIRKKEKVTVKAVVLYKQLYDYFDIIFSRNQYRFRKGFSVVNYLLPMIENRRKSLDQGGAYRALVTDLSKISDCLPHAWLLSSPMPME